MTPPHNGTMMVNPIKRPLLAALAGAIALASPATRAQDAPPPAPPAAAPAVAPDTAPPDPADIVSTTEGADRIIEGALKFLASRQLPNGSWEGNNHQAAVTAYVMIAFMASGQLPGEGEYGRAMTRGLQFLLGCVRPDGYIAAPTGETNMYGHGIATIALSELYGQTHDVEIRTRLERAVQLIIKCQSDAGGWRYQPQKSDADISVTVLQVVALRSAKNSGIDVPQGTIDKAVAYVKSCHKKDSGGFAYQPGQPVGFARTAAAIYSLQVCGRYDDPMVKTGSDYLVDRFDKDREWFVYGNFYAAPAQYMVGGDTWKKWYANVSRNLLSKIRRNAQGVYWPQDGGQGVSDVYTTAVYATILAMPYHYLPLYQR